VLSRRAVELPPIFTTGDATVCFTTGNKSTAGADCAALAVGEIEGDQDAPGAGL
jgi:hypothetical protein